MNKKIAALAAIMLTATTFLMAMKNDKDKAMPAKQTASEATEFAAFKKSDSEWKQILTDTQYRVLRKHGTEPPFRNPYWDNKDKGVYVCAGCEAPLFASAQKYKSGTGWPSFWDPIEPKYVGETVDNTLGMTRTEVHCKRCGGHLGHVFPDGPRPTGLRYCMNSASLEFVEKSELEERQLSEYAKHAK